MDLTMKDKFIWFTLYASGLIEFYVHAQQASMRLYDSPESRNYRTIHMYSRYQQRFYNCMEKSSTCSLFLASSDERTYVVNAVKSDPAVRQYCPTYVCKFKPLRSFETYNGNFYLHKVLCELKDTDHGCTCGNASFLIDWQNQDEYFRSSDEKYLYINKMNCSWIDYFGNEFA